MAYINYIRSYYDSMGHCIGVQTEPGQRFNKKMAIKELFTPEFSDVEDGFANSVCSPTAFLMWYKGVHILVKRGRKNKIEVFLSKNRIYSNKHGCYPETIHSFPATNLSTLSKIVRLYKKYYKLTKLSTFVYSGNELCLSKKRKVVCSDCPFKKWNPDESDKSEKCEKCTIYLTYNMFGG